MEASQNPSPVVAVVNQTELPGIAKKCLCCLDFLKDKTEVVKIMDCSHEICLECFTRWKRLKDTCPLCRTKITKIREAKKDLNKAVDDQGWFTFELNFLF